MQDTVVSKQTRNEAESASNGQEIRTSLNQTIGQNKAWGGIKAKAKLESQEKEGVDNIARQND